VVERLRAIKAEIDPRGLFGDDFSVQPSEEAESAA
jgi:hypothetical protein